MARRFQRLRAFLERVAFAGLKPDVTEGPKKSKLQSLIQSAEDLASVGLGPESKPLPGPRTWRHKVAIIAALLIVGVSIYVLVGFLRKPAEQKEFSGPPPAPVEIVAPGTTVEKNKELEVAEIDFDITRNPKIITGTLRNRTDRAFAQCDISFYLTTKTGAQLGAVDTTVLNLPPRGSARFRILVPMKDAEFTMVRELHAQ
jgi:hypothetical protein